MVSLRHAINGLSRFAHGGGAPAGAVDAVEAALGVALPPDVRPVASVFRGGMIGHFEHFSWSPHDAGNVIDYTIQFRAQGLPYRAVAVGVAGRVLYAITIPEQHALVEGFVLVAPDPPLTLQTPVEPLLAQSFLSYHGFLLDRVETLAYVPVRAALLKQYKHLAPGAARKWRHRWIGHEVEKIVEILTRGVRENDRMPRHVVDGKEYVDLRGVVLPPNHFYAKKAGDGPLLERYDLSYAEGALKGIDARDCLFRGAKISCTLGRFRRCDFTMVDGEHSMWQSFGDDFADCDFTGAYLARCVLEGTFERCNFTGADLWRAAAGSVDPGAFRECVWTSARFGGDAGVLAVMRDPAT